MKFITVWFDIPVTDMARATKFYKEMFGHDLTAMSMGPVSMAMFPMGEGTTGCGSLTMGPGYVPSVDGTKVYFSCGDDMQPQLDKVESLGGKVLMPKNKISDEYGYSALIMDTEGNCVGLHSLH
ncbi:MAG TPA: VOC family protein [Candidatus Saccharimonadales bacterium]|nr:VOC family protein [Candidatus Saccharimonadales bacterium]